MLPTILMLIGAPGGHAILEYRVMDHMKNVVKICLTVYRGIYVYA